MIVVYRRDHKGVDVAHKITSPTSDDDGAVIDFTVATLIKRRYFSNGS